MTKSYDIAKGKYYINLGRWADSVVGPFTSEAEADYYIEHDLTHWTGGQRPSVVTIAPAVERDKQYVVTFVDKAHVHHRHITVQIAAPNAERATRWAQGSFSSVVTHVRTELV